MSIERVALLFMPYMLKIIGLFLALNVVAIGQEVPAFEWIQTATGKHFEYPYSMAVDSQSNVYVTGGIGPEVKFGDQTIRGGSLVTNVTPIGTFINPSSVAFLAKYDLKGKLQWVLQDEGSTNSAGRGLAIDSADNVYVTGEFSGKAIFGRQSAANFTANPDIFLAKFTPAGVCSWLRRAGGPQTDWAYGLAIDGEDNLYFTGFISGSVVFGDITANAGLNQYGTDRMTMYLAKYSSAGAALWLKFPSGFGQSTGYALAASGNSIWLGAGFSGTNNFEGTVVSNTNSFQQNGLVVEYTSAGDVNFVSPLKAPDGIWVNTLAVNEKTNLFISGPFNGSARLGSTMITTTANSFQRYLAKMELDGDIAWAKGLGASVNYNDGVLLGDQDGFVLTTGFTGGFQNGSVSLNSTYPKPGSFGGGDMMMVKFDHAGDAVWGISGGGGLDDGGATAAMGPDGAIYAAGWFREEATFGNLSISGETTSQPQTDIFVTRLGEPASILPVLSIRYLGDLLARVEWPVSPEYSLEETTDLQGMEWKASSRNVSTSNGKNSVLVPVNQHQALFFRLKK
ncbi:MAG: hypothetical protein ACO1QB_18640 [Verrucomicrobiales bacterium]